MNVEATNLTFELEHDCRIIARNTGSTPQKVQEMMKKFIDLGLFDQADGIITCFSLMKRCDEYTNKLLKSNVSGQYRDKVRSNRIEESKVKESRTEESKIDNIKVNKNIDDSFNLFWDAGLVKTGKKKAEQVFKSKYKQAAHPNLFADMLIKDIKTRLSSGQFGFDKIHPATYLNGERWNDELPATNSNQITASASTTFNNVQNVELI